MHHRQHLQHMYQQTLTPTQRSRTIQPLWMMLITLLSAWLTLSLPAQANSDAELEKNIKALTMEAIKLNVELRKLEEQLLFPANTQLAVFVSLDIGHYFKLDAIELQIDGQTVTSHLYTDHDINALKRGGMQKLYMGNLKTGNHKMVAIFTGYGPEARPYRRAVSLDFAKENKTAAFEIEIKDDTYKQQPQFTITQWDQAE